MNSDINKFLQLIFPHNCLVKAKLYFKVVTSATNANNIDFTHTMLVTQSDPVPQSPAPPVTPNIDQKVLDLLQNPSLQYTEADVDQISQNIAKIDEGLKELQKNNAALNTTPFKKDAIDSYANSQDTILSKATEELEAAKKYLQDLSRNAATKNQAISQVTSSLKDIISNITQASQASATEENALRLIPGDIFLDALSKGFLNDLLKLLPSNITLYKMDLEISLLKDLTMNSITNNLLRFTSVAMDMISYCMELSLKGTSKEPYCAQGGELTFKVLCDTQGKKTKTIKVPNPAIEVLNRKNSKSSIILPKDPDIKGLTTPFTIERSQTFFTPTGVSTKQNTYTFTPVYVISKDYYIGLSHTFKELNSQKIKNLIAASSDSIIEVPILDFNIEDVKD